MRNEELQHKTPKVLFISFNAGFFSYHNLLTAKIKPPPALKEQEATLNSPQGHPEHFKCLSYAY